MDSGNGIRSREFRRAGQYASPDGRDAQKCVTTGELSVREPGPLRRTPRPGPGGGKEPPAFSPSRAP